MAILGDAERVVRAFRKAIEQYPDPTVVVHGVWVETPHSACVVYSLSYGGLGQLGRRIVFPPHAYDDDPDSTGADLAQNVKEPLGSAVSYLRKDGRGISWIGIRGDTFPVLPQDFSMPAEADSFLGIRRRHWSEVDGHVLPDLVCAVEPGTSDDVPGHGSDCVGTREVLRQFELPVKGKELEHIGVGAVGADRHGSRPTPAADGTPAKFEPDDGARIGQGVLGNPSQRWIDSPGQGMRCRLTEGDIGVLHKQHQFPGWRRRLGPVEFR